MKEFKVVEVKEITTKDGRKFNAYKVLAKAGKKMDVRFTKTCSNIPSEPSTIVVDESCCNVDTSRQYPILWVKDIIEIKPTEHKNNIDEFFDSKPIFADEMI